MIGVLKTKPTQEKPRGRSHSFKQRGLKSLSLHPLEVQFQVSKW